VRAAAPAVPRRFTTSPHTVTEDEILRFAVLSGDTHPLHTDPEWAAGSRFGEQIAHGLLVLSLAIGLLPFERERIVALRRLCDVVFKRPVKIGDTVTVHGEVVRSRELDEEHELLELSLRIVAGGRLAVRSTVELVWRS
jgi:acyl dehydratase